MSIHRPVKKVFALVLAAGALGAATQIGAMPVAAAAGGQPTGIANNQGNPNAVPPILAPVRSSELAGLEAGELGQFSLDPPQSGRYSNAEMNAYATELR